MVGCRGGIGEDDILEIRMRSRPRERRRSLSGRVLNWYSTWLFGEAKAK